MQPTGDLVRQLFSSVEPSRVEVFSCGHVIPRENLLPLCVSTYVPVVGCRRRRVRAFLLSVLFSCRLSCWASVVSVTVLLLLLTMRTVSLSFDGRSSVRALSSVVEILVVLRSQGTGLTLHVLPPREDATLSPVI